MAELDDARFDLLTRVLEKDFVPHLPLLLDHTKPADQARIKNLSRAFSAFALANVCKIAPQQAAGTVVDDFDDYGIDAIHLNPGNDTLYIVQGKLKKGASFTQDEALAFCQGVKKLLDQDLQNLNQHVQHRRVDIESAVEDATSIQLVVAYIGANITQHADQAIIDLITRERAEDDRIASTYLTFDASAVIDSLQDAKALPKVNADLYISNSSKVSGSRVTYIGVASLTDFIRLHTDYGESLYEKNIRSFLGTKTDVNESIVKSLKSSPGEFFLLNNGVTLLCDLIDRKGNKSDASLKRKFKLRGVSVINGAQTISSAAELLGEISEDVITDARVAVTLIQADSQGDFGKEVTRARNHQNPVHFTNFVALDPEQERLRRELSYLGVRYVYKTENAARLHLNDIDIREAAQALALFAADPRIPIWLKKEPSRFLDTSAVSYKSIFSPSLTPHQVVNAVRFYRYIHERMGQEASASVERERLTYKHGIFALGWILAKRITAEQRKPLLIDIAKLRSELSVPYDTLRQALLDQVSANSAYCGPLAMFRNQERGIPVIETLIIDHYDLGADPVIAYKRAQASPLDGYPKPLFDYIVSKAPQISNLA